MGDARPAAAIARPSQRLVERIAGGGDRCEAERLAGLVAEGAANATLMGDEQVAARCVPTLARVELAAYRRRSSSPAT